MLSFSGVTFVLICFVTTCLRPFCFVFAFLPFFFCFVGDVTFPEYFCSTITVFSLFLLLFLTFSALVANPKKLLYTVANPARGLLNREKKKKKKSGSAPPPLPPARAARSEKLYGEYVVRFFLPDGVFSTLSPRAGFLTSAY